MIYLKPIQCNNTRVLTLLIHCTQNKFSEYCIKVTFLFCLEPNRYFASRLETIAAFLILFFSSYAIYKFNSTIPRIIISHITQYKNKTIITPNYRNSFALFAFCNCFANTTRPLIRRSIN